MLKPTGSGDDRCLVCKSNRCFVCEHKKTAEELNTELFSQNIDKDLNPLFIVSNNISSLNNDPRCLTCRMQHCFQCEHKILETINTNQTNRVKEHLNPFVFSLTPTNFDDQRCLYCINTKCFQCEHKTSDLITNRSTSTTNTNNNNQNSYNTTLALNNTSYVKTKYKINSFYIESPYFKNQNQCYECRLKRCFQCEHKQIMMPLKSTKVEPERVAIVQQPIAKVGVAKSYNQKTVNKNASEKNKKFDSENEEKSSKCCFCC